MSCMLGTVIVGRLLKSFSALSDHCLGTATWYGEEIVLRTEASLPAAFSSLSFSCYNSWEERGWPRGL